MLSTAVVCATLILLGGGCGNKGALYLPDEPMPTQANPEQGEQDTDDEDQDSEDSDG